MYTQNADINLLPGGFPPVVHVSQYDDGLTQIIFTVYKNGENITMPAGTAGVMQGIKPSGLGFSETMTINAAAGTASVVVSATMTEEAGEIPAEIVLTADGARIGTANLLFTVEESPHPAGTTDGDTETARTLLEQMQAAVLAAQTAAASVNPQVITSAETEPTLEADGRYVYVYSNPLTAIDITPAQTGVTSVFFSSPASGACTLTLPAAVILPPGLDVTTDASGHAVELPAGLKYEINIFNNHLLIEAWENG